MPRHRLDDPSQMIASKLRALHGYWNAKRRARAMPARSDIDPVDLPPLLPNLMLVDVAGDPLRFRFRLVGTEIVSRHGMELTGRDLEDIGLGTELGAVRSQYEVTVREAAPTYCRHALETKAGKYLRYERLLLPPSTAGVHVPKMLGGVYLLPDDAAVTPPRR